MSEIFSWLKRAGNDVQNVVPDFAGDSVTFESGSIRKKPHSEVTIRKAAEPSATDAAAPAALFELTGADYRVRTVLDPLTLIGEQYRQLRSKLNQIQRERGLKVLMVTSSVPYEGKTFTACCLAGVFAQEPGKRVLLVDADLRKPRVARSFGINGDAPEGGLSLVLRGQQIAAEALLKHKEGEFFVLPSGPVPQDPAELLSSPALERMIRSLTPSFDWIVIDSPPVIAIADASILAPLADAVLMVVHQDRTPAKVIKQAIQRIGPQRICGIVLNRGKRLKHSRYYYTYYRTTTAELPAKAGR